MAKKKEEKDTNEFYAFLENKYKAYFEPDVYKTGIVALDEVLNGGLETGSLIELSSESQAGKSTLVLHLAKNFAEKGLKTLYIDSEGSVKNDMLKGIGLLPYLSTADNKRNMFTLVRESGYSKVEELISMALQNEDFKLFVIDSLTALTYDDYLDLDSKKDIVDHQIGLDARLNGRLLKKLNALKTTYNCIFIIINQTRTNMGGYVVTKESTGGQAVKFYPDVRLFMKVKEKIQDEKELIIGKQKIYIGANCTIEAKKSRVGSGFIQFPITIYYGKGVSNLTAYVNLLPTIKVNGKPVLKQLSPVSYELNVNGKKYNTSKGKNGLNTLIVEHYDELVPIVEEHLENFYKKVADGLTDIESEEIIEEVQSEDYELDDTLIEEENEQTNNQID